MAYLHNNIPIRHFQAPIQRTAAAVGIDKHLLPFLPAAGDAAVINQHRQHSLTN